MTNQLQVGVLVLVLVVVALPMVQCSSDTSFPTTAPSATGAFGTVRSMDGVTLEGVAVTMGSAATTTDSTGAWQLVVAPGEYVVRFERDGFGVRAVEATVLEGSATAIPAALVALADPVLLDAEVGGSVNSEGFEVTLSADALVDANGERVGGEIAVRLTPISTSAWTSGPGALVTSGSDASRAPLETFGMMDITIRDGANDLNLAPDTPAAIRIPVPDDVASPDATMPLWSFDEQTGRWVEEGVLTLDESGTGWVGEITHLSWWNADKRIETGCVSGTVVDSLGTPVAGARIVASGVDYRGSSDAQTDAEGRFFLPVRQQSAVLVTATHADGGGEQREVTSGPGPISGPVRNHPDCIDGGTWTVEVGVVRLADGDRVSCEGLEQSPVATCVPTWRRVYDCFAPSGECSATGLSTTWSNGSRQDIGISGAADSTITYFGPGGQRCGSQSVTLLGGDAVAFEVTDANGNAGRSEVTPLADGGSRYTCEDGRSVTISASEAAAWEACYAPNDADCSGGGGGSCSNNEDCGPGDACCFGACIPDYLCGFSASCRTSDDCADGGFCCTFDDLNLCVVSEQVCYEYRECTGDADCGPLSCCSGLCRDPASCG